MTIFVSLFFLILTACRDSVSSWDGGFADLTDEAQACAIGWIGNYHTIKGVEAEIEKSFVNSKNSWIIKMGTSGRAAYEFFGIFELGSGYKVVYGSPRFERVIVEDLSDLYASKLISLSGTVADLDSNIVQIPWQKWSHTPCEFVRVDLSKSRVYKAYIGELSQEDIDEMAQLLFEIREKIASGVSEQEPTQSAKTLPPDIELERLEETIRGDLFFEVAPSL